MRTPSIPFPFLFALQDRQVVDLPEDMLEARAALVRLLAHQLSPVAHLAQMSRDAIETYLRSARDDDDLPDRVDFAAVRADHDAHDEAAMALAMACTEQAGHLSGLIIDQRDHLIHDVLAPVHERLIASAGTAARDLAGVDMSATGIALADAKTRKALVEVSSHVEAYGLIRTAWARLFELPDPSVYEARVSWFGWVRNPMAVGVAPEMASVTNTWRPWSRDDAMSRLLWFAGHPEAEPWMPTPAEHDAVIRAVFAEGIGNLERSRAAAIAVRG